jgi:predicted DNA-binding protein
MTEDEVVAWFRSAKELTTLLGDTLPAPATSGLGTSATSATSADVSMMLVSIRLPVMLVEQLDQLANSRGVRRADVIREAISVFVADEPERAMDVLRRVVGDRSDSA